MKIYAFLMLCLIPVSTFAQSQNNESCIAQARDNEPNEYALIVNTHHIGSVEFQTSLKLEARTRYYHLAAPEGQTEEFALEIADQLISDRLLSDYAYFEQEIPLAQTKLAIRSAEIDEELVDQELSLEQIQSIKNFYLCQLERATVIEDFKIQFNSQIAINQDEVLNYYHLFPEKFTSPVRNRLGVILIGVDPSANNDAWVKAKSVADEVYFKLQNGDLFESLAREYSTDISARDGGDMGYQHLGMLGDAIEEQAAELTAGSYSGPVYLLEGWAIIKLIEQQPPKLNSFEYVEERATALALRAKKENEWNNLLTTLRENAAIQYVNIK